MLDQWIEQLSKEIELGRTLPREGAAYAFPIDEGVIALISEYEQGFSLSCVIGECPAEKIEEFYFNAMLANLFGQGTKGAILGLSDDYRFVTLTLESSYADSYREFRDKLEDFLNMVDFWREEINQNV